jgi:hypothetical protein
MHPIPHSPIQLDNPHNSRLVTMANAVLAHRFRMRQLAAAKSPELPKHQRSPPAGSQRTP